MVGNYHGAGQDSKSPEAIPDRGRPRTGILLKYTPIRWPMLLAHESVHGAWVLLLLLNSNSYMKPLRRHRLYWTLAHPHAPHSLILPWLELSDRLLARDALRLHRMMLPAHTPHQPNQRRILLSILHGSSSSAGFTRQHRACRAHCGWRHSERAMVWLEVEPDRHAA